MELVFTILISIAVGLIVGMLSGLLGVGGGTVLVPVFRLIYGMPAIAATATSLFTIIPTSASGVVTHLRNKTCVPLLGVAAGIGGACTSPVGVWLASLSPEWAIMAAAALVIGYSAVTMFGKAIKLWKKQHSGVGLAEPVGGAPGTRNQIRTNLDRAEVSHANSHQESDFERPRRDIAQGDNSSEFNTENLSGGAGGRFQDLGMNSRERPRLEPNSCDPETDPSLRTQSGDNPNLSKKKLAILGAVIGIGAGLVSGYVGVGGGFIMVPLFMQLLHTPMKLTSGTSLVAVMILAIPATVTQAMLGNVDWVAGVFVAAGTVPGAAVGSKLISRVPELVLRFGFSAFLLVAAALLVLNQLGVF